MLGLVDEDGDEIVCPIFSFFPCRILVRFEERAEQRVIEKSE